MDLCLRQFPKGVGQDSHFSVRQLWGRQEVVVCAECTLEMLHRFVVLLSFPLNKLLHSHLWSLNHFHLHDLSSTVLLLEDVLTPPWSPLTLCTTHLSKSFKAGLALHTYLQRRSRVPRSPLHFIWLVTVKRPIRRAPCQSALGTE